MQKYVAHPQADTLQSPSQLSNGTITKKTSILHPSELITVDVSPGLSSSPCNILHHTPTSTRDMVSISKFSFHTPERCHTHPLLCTVPLPDCSLQWVAHVHSFAFSYARQPGREVFPHQRRHHLGSRLCLIPNTQPLVVLEMGEKGVF